MVLGSPSVPFVPTRKEVLDMVFEALDLREGDVLYDLGCGDGRVIMEAAKKYPIKKAVGVELREELVKDLMDRVKKENASRKVQIIHDDFFKAPISDATVVYMYLLTSVNESLKPKLRQELKPGSRVVTLDFQIPGWKPVKILGDKTGWQKTVYVYVIGISDMTNHPS
ncbi:MAG: class I SAM-dependent methyltransferase [Caldisphaeraceae archaeon]|nr:class I SAM-dependent methyltransferase [Caldisphaeraceae archaeon]